MRAWIVALVVAISLAGCSGDSEPDETPAQPNSETGGEPGSGAGNSTGGGSTGGQSGTTPGENTPPTATLLASIENATVPFFLNFTLTGEDADGDNLTWTLVIDGNLTLANGTELPATVAWNVTAPGNHTAVLTVDDGHAATTAMANVTGIAAPAAQEPARQEVAGNIDGYSPACIPEAPYDVGSGGFVEVAVDPRTIGTPYSFSFQSASVFDAFIILDGAGGELVRTVVGLHMPFDWAGSGTVPAGAATLVFAACDNSLAVPNGQGEGFAYEAGA